MDVDCCICGEKYVGTESIVIIKHTNDANLDVSRKRGHYFHRDCLDLWKKTQESDNARGPGGATCPLDRDPIGKVYSVPSYQVAGFNIGLYNYDFKDVLRNLKVTEKLLEQFPDIDEIDKNNCTLAFYACKIGNYSLINKLTKRGADFNRPCGRHAFTPLMAAVCHNHRYIVDRLLSVKRLRKDIMNHDLTGMTAFGYACKHSYYSIINSFLVHHIPTQHEAQYYLRLCRDTYLRDKMYGKDIIESLYHYLKSDTL